MPTISEQLTQLVSDRDDLVSNLTTKGISGLTGDETFTELVPEVLNIPSGGGGTASTDWSQIGYSAEPQSVIDGFDYAKTIYDNWDSSQTSYSAKFSNDYNLKYMPLVDMSNGTNFHGVFNNCSNLENVPQLNTSSGTNFRNMFNNCPRLTTIPQLDTSNGTDFGYMFENCSKLTTIPQLDTSNGTDFHDMFNYCSSLTTIPQLNTSNGTNFQNMFRSCSKLTTIPQLDTSSGTNFGYMFSNCSNLTTVPQFDATNCINIYGMFRSCSKLTTVAGLLNLGSAYLTTVSANYNNYILDFGATSLITHDSLMNVINNLYDIATKGCNAQQLYLGSTNLAKLTAEEISTCTSKGWSVS